MGSIVVDDVPVRGRRASWRKAVLPIYSVGHDGAGARTAEDENPGGRIYEATTDPTATSAQHRPACSTARIQFIGQLTSLTELRTHWARLAASSMANCTHAWHHASSLSFTAPAADDRTLHPCPVTILLVIGR